MSRVTFDVYGSAQPQGSKSLMPNGAMLEGGTAELRANRRNWRSAVAAAAADALADQLAGRQMDGPLSLDVVFRAPMPASRSKAIHADLPLPAQLIAAQQDATTAQDERDLWDDIATALYARSDAVFSRDDPAGRAYRAARNGDTDGARKWLA